MASKEEDVIADNEKGAATASKHLGKTFLLVLIGAVTFVILALSLGLGLGLGLKHHTSESASSQNVTSSTATSTAHQPTATAPPSSAGQSTDIPSWRRDPSEYVLDMSWDLNAAPTTRVYNLTVSNITAAPDGVFRYIFAINGQFPGPVIEVNEGDRVLINVTNELLEPTTMHWHGMYQNGTNWMDGSSGITQCPIPAGGSFLYNFTIVGQYGTYWYHSHYSTQYTDGIVGPFIVHSPAEATIQKSYDYDQIVLIQDWYHDPSETLIAGYLASGNENAEPLPDDGLILGTNFFNCSSYGDDSGYDCVDNSTRAMFDVIPNKTYRFRLINTGAFGEFQVSIDNHTLTVIEADSTYVEPLTVHRLQIHVAQRYSVLFTTNQTATNYWFRAQMDEHCFSSVNPVLDTDVRALISYTNTTTDPTESVDWADALDLACDDLNPSLLVPTDVIQAPDVDVTYVIEVSFQIGAYALDKAYINSTTWTPLSDPTLNQAVAGLQSSNTSAEFSTSGLSTAISPSSQFIITNPTTATIDLLINNLDEGAHPFHLHGHQFFILATGSSGDFQWSSYPSLNLTNPMRRDTMTVDAYGWSLIRFVADNPGMWPFHCHISWHVEAGLLMQFMSRTDIMRTWTLPEDVVGLCEADGAGDGV